MTLEVRTPAKQFVSVGLRLLALVIDCRGLDSRSIRRLWQLCGQGNHPLIDR